MATPAPQKLIVKIIPPGRKPASGQTAEQAVRALARIIGRQIARDQFRKQQEKSPKPRDRTGRAEAWPRQQVPDAEEQ